MSRRAYSCAVIAGAFVAYFAIFPDDLGFVERLLRLTQSVAVGAWAVDCPAAGLRGSAHLGPAGGYANFGRNEAFAMSAAIFRPVRDRLASIPQKRQKPAR